MRNLSRLCFLLAACACFGSAATDLGDSDTYPLISVDGAKLPTTISDSTGASAQVTSGSLTTRSSTAQCDYKISLSTGKTISGTKNCSLIGDAKPVGNGVQLIIDAVDGGGPAGAHYYNFLTNTGKPCTCGVFCPGGPCATDRALDSARAIAVPDLGQTLDRRSTDPRR